MLWLYVIVGVAALEVGFVFGVIYGKWAAEQRAEQERIDRIWLGVKTSIQSGKHIDVAHYPEEFLAIGSGN
jgi:hypothetical protein